MSDPMWVLVGYEADDDGVPLCWNNDHGWVNRTDATVFTTDEVFAFDEPQGSMGWRKA